MKNNIKNILIVIMTLLVIFLFYKNYNYNNSLKLSNKNLSESIIILSNRTKSFDILLQTLDSTTSYLLDNNIKVSKEFKLLTDSLCVVIQNDIDIQDSIRNQYK